ncbi:hypothetical protein GCM10009304_13910 [Pseudomonas matsuisoli]|uniref:Uncharacterized protein n=1 Tax=Pseudomonas matsuisoli TaxID=1515666 RepID=A0A917PSK5_9PSED|nr:hypothetical protein GCM10009304_13910 [Pseudomonas matsuisoli]
MPNDMGVVVGMNVDEPRHQAPPFALYDPPGGAAAKGTDRDDAVVYDGDIRDITRPARAIDDLDALE